MTRPLSSTQIQADIAAISKRLDKAKLLMRRSSMRGTHLINGERREATPTDRKI